MDNPLSAFVSPRFSAAIDAGERWLKPGTSRPDALREHMRYHIEPDIALGWLSQHSRVVREAYFDDAAYEEAISVFENADNREAANNMALQTIGLLRKKALDGDDSAIEIVSRYEEYLSRAMIDALSDLPDDATAALVEEANDVYRRGLHLMQEYDDVREFLERAMSRLGEKDSAVAASRLKSIIDLVEYWKLAGIKESVAPNKLGTLIATPALSEMNRLRNMAIKQPEQEMEAKEKIASLISLVNTHTVAEVTEHIQRERYADRRRMETMLYDLMTATSSGVLMIPYTNEEERVKIVLALGTEPTLATPEDVQKLLHRKDEKVV